MATNYWRGDAQTVRQVNTTTIGGTIGSETFTMTVNGKTASVTATGSETAAAIANSLGALIDALIATEEEWGELSVSYASGSAVITLTGPTDGRPFTQTATASGTATASVSTTVAAGSPNDWDNDANWSTGSKPAGTDVVIFENNDVDCLYGLDQSGVSLAALYIKASYTGRIGLPVKNAGYYEYRDTDLQIIPTVCKIGEGEGAGSPRIRLDFGSTAFTMEVWSTGDSETDDYPVVVKGTHATLNTLRVYRGRVGVGLNNDSDASTITNLVVGYVDDPDNDAVVECGRAVTVTNVSKQGGQVTIASATTTILNNAGTLVVEGSGTAASVVVNGGTVDYRSSGTITQFHVADGAILDFSHDMQDRTVTNGNLYAGGTLLDPFRTCTWSNPLELTRCSLTEVTLDLGTHITLAPADA